MPENLVHCLQAGLQAGRPFHLRQGLKLQLPERIIALLQATLLEGPSGLQAITIWCGQEGCLCLRQ